MKSISSTARVLIVSAISIFMFATISKAEDIKSFSISPPNFEINANPGDSIKNTIKVENLSDTKINFSVKGENFVAYGEGGQVSLTEEDSTYSINKWLVFDNKEFSLDAKKQYLFEFSIKIPQNAEPGSHYGAVVFSNNPSTDTSGSFAKVVQQIGALVLIRIPGEIKEDAKLISFAPISQTITEPKIKMNTLVENTGVVHFKMPGTINIYDVFGNKVKSIEVKAQNILPSSKRMFETEFDFDNFGYFRAETEMFYANGEKVLKADTNFIALNLAKSIPIGVTILAIGLVYIIFHKRINKAIKIIVKGS